MLERLMYRKLTDQKISHFCSNAQYGSRLGIDIFQYPHNRVLHFSIPEQTKSFHLANVSHYYAKLLRR